MQVLKGKSSTPIFVPKEGTSTFYSPSSLSNPSSGVYWSLLISTGGPGASGSSRPIALKPSSQLELLGAHSTFSTYFNACSGTSFPKKKARLGFSLWEVQAALLKWVAVAVLPITLWDGTEFRYTPALPHSLNCALLE